MDNSNNTGKILAIFTAIIFLFFIYEVMTNANKVNQTNTIYSNMKIRSFNK